MGSRQVLSFNRRTSVTQMTVAMEKANKDWSIVDGGEADGWSLVDGGEADGWISWESLGQNVKDPKHLIEWKRCSDMHIGWSGLVRFSPGQELPLHKHDPPEIYYILKGHPLLILGGDEVRGHPLACISIPSLCPHKLINDTDKEVLVMYVYMEVGGNSVKPGQNHNWTFLEEV